MRIRVHYQAQLADAAGTDGETLELPDGATIADVARLAADRHGPDVRRVLLGEDGAPLPWILTTVNDRAVPRGDSPPLADGDELAFLSPISGG